MIAVWLVYTLVSGTLIACVCWLVEYISRSARLATRGIWVGGMVAMLGVGAAAMIQARPAPAVAPALAESGVIVQATPGDGGHVDARGFASLLRERVDGWVSALDTRAARATERLAPWDLPLIALWTLLSAILASVAARATFEGRRLRSGLRPHQVIGSTVLLSDDMGPAAVGVRRSAIVMPRWALDLDEAFLKLVIRHEREHLRARDPLLLLVTLVAVILVPWHLPLWWARKRLWLAIEMDCDRRVLRAHPDVRRYGQLLLLTAQRAPNARANLAVLTVVAPLRPHVSHLSRRISAMTQPRHSRLPLRAIPLLLGALAISAVVSALPVPHRADAQGTAVLAPASPARAIVHLTDVGLINTTSPSILVYTTGGGQVGIGADPPAALTDTLRLHNLPAMVADVTDGDIHIELRGPGSIRVGGDVTGGPALKISATGRHLVLRKGGSGISGMP
jgi:hypothetical protein